MRLLNLFETSRQFSKAFYNWFHNSVLTNIQGNPLVCYHGTNKHFDNFEIRNDSHDTGIYFTIDPHYASQYAVDDFNIEKLKINAHVKPAYIRMTNPYCCMTKPTDIELKLGNRGAFTQHCMDYFKSKGYDGLLVGITDYDLEKKDSYFYKHLNEICCFSNDQIKSIFDQNIYEKSIK